MTKIEFVRSDGVKLLADGTGKKNDVDWAITKLEGLASPNIDLHSEQNGYGNGSFLTGFAYPERDVRVVAAAKNNDNTLRRRALSFFTTSKDIKMIITYRGVTRWITGRVSGKQIAAENIHSKPTFDITISCVDPFFKEVNTNENSLSSNTKCFHFPYHNVIGKTFEVAHINHSNNTVIENLGDEEALPIIEVEVGGATSLEIMLKNSNGEYMISLENNLASGDIVNIDIANIQLAINGENGFNKLTSNSSFTDFKLTPGDNFISIDNSSHPEYITVTVKYRNSYLGV